MLDSTQYEDLSLFLSDCVEKLKKDYPRYSNLQLSKMVDMTNSSFDRIYKKEAKKPKFNNAIKIVRSVCGDEDIKSFIKRFYPDMLEQFERVYSGNSNVPFVKPEAEAFFQDPSTYEIMMMVTSSTDITKEDIQAEFGRKGLAIVDKLLALHILRDDDKSISIKGSVNATQPTVQTLLKNLVEKSYDVDAFGEKLNYLTLQYEGVNKEYVAPRLLEILRRANTDIRQLFNLPQAKGRDVMWAGLVMDTLIKDPQINSNDGVLQ